MRKLLARLVREDRGQDLIEYALLAGFISIIAVVAITETGTAINQLFQAVRDEVQDAVP